MQPMQCTVLSHRAVMPCTPWTDNRTSDWMHLALLLHLCLYAVMYNQVPSDDAGEKDGKDEAICPCGKACCAAMHMFVEHAIHNCG